MELRSSQAHQKTASGFSLQRLWAWSFRRSSDLSVHVVLLVNTKSLVQSHDMDGARPETDAADALNGLVERVTFHNPENGFCVLRAKVRGQRDLVTVLGNAASVQPGEFIQAYGRWDNHREHGLQFRARDLKVLAPTTLEGIEKYLGSGMIKGIGPHFARKLVKGFGEEVFDVIESTPDRLRELDGIGPKRIAKLTAGWAEQKAIREIMVFLQSHGVGTAHAVRIYKTYQADAIATVRDNPYRLARDIRGIGFLTADRIAEKLGIEKTAMIRARAGITYTLAEAISDGHCGLPEDELLPMAVKLLEIPDDILRDALRLELAENGVVADTIGDRRCIFLHTFWSAERAIAEELNRLSVGTKPWPVIDPLKAIPWVEKSLDVELAVSQRNAVATALASKVMVITGGPGVGKTTLVNAILRILRAKDIRVALAAPTGRAAKRLSESTGLDALTIHRLLEIDPMHGGFKRGPDYPLECDLLVVDETSMVDVVLMASLVKALPSHAAVFLVGDVDQLPSVGPGQVLTDLIGSNAVPVARLTEVFRQAATSQIITNAHRINAGKMPELSAQKGSDSDFYFVEARDPADGIDKIREIVTTRLPRRFGFNPVRDIQILCPMNRGGLGARALNVEMQSALNPGGSGPEVERFGNTYRIGDKVMQTGNDYDKDVFNGDIGVVTAIDPDAQELVIEIDGRPVEYRFGELDEVALAYAVSIHKSQGSEYPAVVIPLMMQHFMMLKRNLLYTGVTRGKQLVILVGERRAVGMAIKAGADARRWSKLEEWIRKGVRAPDHGIGQIR